MNKETCSTSFIQGAQGQTIQALYRCTGSDNTSIIQGAQGQTVKHYTGCTVRQYKHYTGCTGSDNTSIIQSAQGQTIQALYRVHRVRQYKHYTGCTGSDNTSIIHGAQGQTVQVLYRVHRVRQYTTNFITKAATMPPCTVPVSHVQHSLHSACITCATFPAQCLYHMCNIPYTVPVSHVQHSQILYKM
jgi:hypothetical protein